MTSKPGRLRHSHCVGQPLAERSGRRLDTHVGLVLRMSGRAIPQLAEILQLVNGNVVSREMQQGVQQHRAVPIGYDEAVPVRPFGVGRVVLQKVVPQHLGNVGHAHRHAGMS